MNIIPVNNPTTPFVVIEDTFTDFELDGIWSELDYYCKTKELLTVGNGTGGALDSSGNRYIKNNYGVFLYELWLKPEFSFLLKYGRKLFDPQVGEEIANANIHMRAYKTSNYDTCLLSYYEDEQYYDTHTDGAQYTIVTWLYREPKDFDGGEFIFNDSNLTIECKNNMTIIFPSYYYHMVNSVKMKRHYEEKLHGYGRFTLSQWAFQLPTSRA